MRIRKANPHGFAQDDNVVFWDERFWSWRSGVSYEEKFGDGNGEEIGGRIAEQSSKESGKASGNELGGDED
jgi:hypothetical protein